MSSTYLSLYYHLVFSTEVLRKYIRNQREHHRKKTFQEEYIELLKEYGIEFDEKYLW